MVKIKNPMTIVSSGGSATLVSKTITANGQYNPADDNAAGYSAVTVAIPAPVNKFKSLVDNTITSVTEEDLAGVTSIKNGAFWGCNNLASIQLPNGITGIGDRAFYGCSGLTRIDIPSSVTSFGERAFNNCTGLTGVYITDLSAWCKIIRNLESTVSSPLSSAHNLYLNGQLVVDLIIPADVSTVEALSFGYATCLHNITVPDTATIIGNGAFSNCSYVQSIRVGNGVTEIRDRGFESTGSNAPIIIGSALSSIGFAAFRYSQFAYMVISAQTPPTITNANAFTSTGSGPIYVPYSADHSILAAYKAATNWSALESRIFEDFAIIYQITGTGECEVYTTAGNRLEPNVVIPSVSPAGDTVISIGSDAFQGNNIVSVAVPNTVEIINGNNAGGGAFEHCSYLETVSIGNGITHIGKSIFKDCTALESVTIYATTPPTLEDVNAFENTTCTIYVPAASVNAYKTATNWSALADRIFAIQE